jgi:hypothetical protein
MTDLRTAAQQALEALLKSHTCPLLPDDCEEAITALRAALAQQAEPVEQMPVGWLESPHGAFRADPLYKMQFPSQLLQWQIALYTAPPQRKPLTQEQLYALYDEHATHQEEGPAMSGWFDFARAIERAHGITDPQIADRLACHGIPMPEGDNDGR